MRGFGSRALACVALTLAATVVVPTQALSQEASSEERLPQHRQVFGYQDPATGAFHPLPLAVPDATVPPVAGTITLTLHITLKTAVPTGGKVACSSDLLASYSSVTGATTYEESGSAYATVSGATATCIVKIPYSWQFPAVTTTDIESLTGSYTAELVNPSSATLVLLARSSSSTFVSLSGHNVFTVTTLSYSANVTL